MVNVSPSTWTTAFCNLDPVLCHSYPQIITWLLTFASAVMNTQPICWWAKYWLALSDRAETVCLLTLLCCGGLAWLSSFLEAYPKQTWSNNSLIGWRLIMKLSLSSRSLSGEGTKWEEGGRQWGERIQQPLWASQTGREDDEFGRGIKRVLIQLGKIYGQMRIWQWTL